MEQFLAVSPGRDLISLQLKPFRVFICTLAPKVYELIWMLIKLYVSSVGVFWETRRCSTCNFFPKYLSIFINRSLCCPGERTQTNAEAKGSPESTFLNKSHPQPQESFAELCFEDTSAVFWRLEQRRGSVAPGAEQRSGGCPEWLSRLNVECSWVTLSHQGRGRTRGEAAAATSALRQWQTERDAACREFRREFCRGGWITGLCWAFCHSFLRLEDPSQRKDIIRTPCHRLMLILCQYVVNNVSKYWRFLNQSFIIKHWYFWLS